MKDSEYYGYECESPRCPSCGGESERHQVECDECTEKFLSDNGFFE